MARKKIREFDSKRLLKQHYKEITGRELPLQVAQVRKNSNFKEVLDQHQWMNSTKLVVKPDMLFGKRGKHDLVGLNLTSSEAFKFIEDRMGKVIDMDGCVGSIDTFIIEPFVPHKQEYYLCFQSQRFGVDVSFSEAGGVEIEENWDKVKKVTIQTLDKPNSNNLATLIANLPLEIKPKMVEFISGCFQVYETLHFSLMEMNPFTLDANADPFPLDMRGELDDTAHFKAGTLWGDVEFPLPFGRNLTPAESYIASLDAATGASLKLSILNPKARIWTMVAGGGASVIYADTVGDLGYAEELGNYAEYSGAPNTKETYLYAKTLLQCATSQPDERGRALLIGGGIANFTDVAATFKGIIQAIRENAEAIRAAKMKIFVRRGGPNYQTGLDLMKTLATDIDIPMEVYGPQTSMTNICQLAIDYVKATA